ncbi:MAG: hypothetical protein H6587_02195 [Flavobacteriales bacterium]|nr:hypothetical protein [Flavobacteriales bacterium]MCB9363356.1 hypothetical protein [Flavobacteriales bacterium]
MKNLLLISLFLISYNFCFSSTFGDTGKESTTLNCNKYDQFFKVEEINKVIDESLLTNTNSILKNALLSKNKNYMVAIEDAAVNPALQQEFDKFIASDY